MRSLLWKEWHEQRWKLAFSSLMLGAFALIGLRARIIADETLMRYVCGIAVLSLPVFSSTGLVPAERGDGTLESLMSLPIRAWRIFAAKTVMGVLLCAGPIVVAAIVSVAVCRGRELSSEAMIGIYARALLGTLSLFFWMLALTVRLPTETRAALTAMGILVMWLIASMGLTYPTQRGIVPSPLWAVDPLSVLVGTNVGSPIMVLANLTQAITQAIIALALWLWAVRQFAKPQEGGK